MSQANENFGGTRTDPAGATKAAVLADVLRERGPLPEPELLKTFLEVLRDLERAHGEGLLHRDISPAHIVLDGVGWKLTDYGLAKVGAVKYVSTVRYMSPERCQGKPMDFRSDIYSLGVVLFQAATGKLPFDAEMKFQIMEAHVGTPPPDPRTINPAISVELERVIHRALAKDPAERFQSAGEFRRALEEIAGVPVQPVELTPATLESTAQPKEVPAQGEPESNLVRPQRVKLAPIFISVGAVIAVVAGLLLYERIGLRSVPVVTGLSREAAGQALRTKGLRVEAATVDDTLPAGVVVAQDPEAGEKVHRSSVVRLSVSGGTVALPELAGIALDDARAQLARLAIDTVKVDSQYSDGYAAGMVMASSLKPGTKVPPHTSVKLTVSAGRATCPQCGARREPNAMFCTKCGYKF
jgi:serine/threonine-protein kinase